MKSIVIEDIQRNHQEDKLIDLQNDYVQLHWHEAGTKLMRKTSENGVDVIFRLFEQNRKILHDDVLYIDDDMVLYASIMPCEVIIIKPQSMTQMAKACYEIGNKHAPLFMQENLLMMPYEAPLYKWLQEAGFAPEKSMQRLSNGLRSHAAAHTHHTHAH